MTSVIEVDSITVITTQEEVPVVIESIGIGPPGPPGPQGPIGEMGNLDPGDTDGDIIRWNADEEKWEVRSGPPAFAQIILTPAEAAALDAEGGLWYKSTDKSVYVCTDV